jgi:hypothetical protein
MCTYPRPDVKWTFRRNMGPKHMFFRTLACLVLLCFDYLMKGGTPKAREDREWIRDFSFVMIVFFAILHTIAYIPSAMFGSFSDMVNAARGAGEYAYESFSEVHWCAALVLGLLAAWPMIAFVLLIVGGFDPYKELTDREMKLQDTASGSILALVRWALHLYLCVVTIYLIYIILMMHYIRNSQKRVGENYKWAYKVSRRPYGSIFFEAGEFHDCALCLKGIWKNDPVVKLASGEVFHAPCLKEQVTLGMRNSIISGKVIVPSAKPEPQS